MKTFLIAVLALALTGFVTPAAAIDQNRPVLDVIIVDRRPDSSCITEPQMRTQAGESLSLGLLIFCSLRYA